jgi:hypothetical protein
MVDLKLYMVHNDHLEDSPDLQPFHARKWHPVSYAVWSYLYTNLAGIDLRTFLRCMLTNMFMVF